MPDRIRTDDIQLGKLIAAGRKPAGEKGLRQTATTALPPAMPSICPHKLLQTARALLVVAESHESPRPLITAARILLDDAVELTCAESPRSA